MRTAGEVSGPQDYNFSSTSYEPNDYSLTETYVEFNQESVTEQRFPEDLDCDHAVICQTLFNAYRRRVDHPAGEGLSSGLSSSSMSHDRTGNPLSTVTKVKNQVTKFRDKTLKTNRFGLSWTDKGSKSSLTVKRRLADTNSRLIMTEEVYKNYLKRSSRSKTNFIVLKQKNAVDKIINFFMNSYWIKTGIFREAHEKSLNEMEELKKLQSSTFDTIARWRLVEDQDTILELIGKIQELQNVINGLNDSRDFQDAESVRSGHSHVTSQPESFPPHPVPGGMPSRSIGMPSRREGPPSIWDTHGISGNVFASPVASSTAPYPQELNPWSSGQSEPIHSSTADQNENQTPVQDQWCQSGPSAKSSVIFSGGDSSKNYGADQQRLQISDLHFDKFPTPATFACWKIRFNTEQCTGSQFLTEAMHWIKEVEMADSVDDLTTSSSVRGISKARFWSTRCEGCFSTEQNHP